MKQSPRWMDSGVKATASRQRSCKQEIKYSIVQLWNGPWKSLIPSVDLVVAALICSKILSQKKKKYCTLRERKTRERDRGRRNKTREQEVTTVEVRSIPSKWKPLVCAINTRWQERKNAPLQPLPPAPFCTFLHKQSLFACFKFPAISFVTFSVSMAPCGFRSGEWALQDSEESRPAKPTRGRQRQEDCELEASLACLRGTKLNDRKHGIL